MTLSLFACSRGRSINTSILVLFLAVVFCATWAKPGLAFDDSIRVVVAEAEADWYEIESNFAAGGVDVFLKTEDDPDWLREEARGSAILNAEKRALEQVLSLLMPYGKIEDNREALDQELLIHANQYSATDEVIFVHLRGPDLSDRKDKGTTTVRVRLFVEMDKVKSKLMDMGLYEETVPAANALLLLQLNVADVPMGTTGCRREFADALRSNGINVLEPEDLQDSLPEQTPYDFSGIDWLTELGEEFAADFVFVVECTGTIRKAEELYTKTLLKCSVDGKCIIVDVVNDSILDQEEVHAESMAEQAAQAGRDACMKACTMLSDLIVPRARMRWSDRYWDGVNVTVEIEDVTYPLLEKFIRTLQELKWVNKAEQESVVSNQATVAVNVRDDATGLAATIRHLPNIPVEVIKVSPDKILLKRIPERGEPSVPKDSDE